VNKNEVWILAASRVQQRREIRRLRALALAALLSGNDIDPSLIDSPSRQKERAQLLGPAQTSSSPAGGDTEPRKLYEAIIGTDDRLPRRFLMEGEMAARPVGRIAVPQSDGTLYGTGALIGPRLIITNHHVIDSYSSAQGASIEFGFYDPEQGQSAPVQSFSLNPAEVFVTHSDLDFSVVAVDTSTNASSIESFGMVGLIPFSGKALVGEHVNIVQHGDGGPQTLSMRSNTVVDVFDDWIHYTSDTEPGASGSPVFNDSWQAVAIHHASVPADDASQGMVNEGIRISSIVQRLVSDLNG
jgi:endonuclease G